MRVSIITVVRNAEATISEAVESILGQDYESIEYVVVDGASDDGTLSVLDRYSNRLDVLISEPDRGIFDALNKGLGRVSGDVVGLLHADDRLAAPSVIREVAKRFQASDRPEVVYGDLVYVRRDRPDRVRRRWIAGEIRPQSFRFGWMPPHPTVFLRREVFERCGEYDVSFGTAADYEFLVRVLVKDRARAAYLPRTITEMRTGGASALNLATRLAANRQDRRAWDVNGLQPAWFTRYAKPIRKIAQYYFALDGGGT